MDEPLLEENIYKCKKCGELCNFKVIDKLYLVCGCITFIKSINIKNINTFNTINKLINPHRPKHSILLLLIVLFLNNSNNYSEKIIKKFIKIILLLPDKIIILLSCYITNNDNFKTIFNKVNPSITDEDFDIMDLYLEKLFKNTNYEINNLSNFIYCSVLLFTDLCYEIVYYLS